MSDMDDLIEEVKWISRAYLTLTGRSLGTTGELGEREAARLLGLKLCVARQKGFDATRSVRGTEERLQIKPRCRTEDSGSQRLGHIDTKAEWDAVLLAILDGTYEVERIHEARRPEIIAALDAPGSVSRNVRRRMPLGGFLKISRAVWTRGSGPG